MVKLKNNQYKIIDAHLHLPWQDEYSTIEEKLERLQKEMRDNGIDYGVLIADSILESSIGNNEECLSVVSNANNLFLVFGISPLERLDEQLLYCEKLLRENKVVGIKLYPGHEDFCMNDSRIKDIINLCIKYEVPLLIHTEWNSEDYPQYSHPYFIKQLAQNNSDLNIICCHIWNPRVIESLKLTQEISNVFYDISSFCMGKQFIKDHPKTLFPRKEKSIEYLRHLMETCGERVIFGSDYGSLSMAEHLELVLEAGLKDDEIRNILYKNANNLFDLGL